MWIRARAVGMAGAVILCGGFADADDSSSHRSGSAVIAVTVQPSVVRLGQPARIVVRTSEPWQDLRLRLEGSTTAIGLLSPWLRFRRRGGAWVADVPPLELRGVYPIELRERPGGRVWRAPEWLFRVLAPGTSDRPAFPTPEGVAHEWVGRQGVLRALRRWPLSSEDRRLPALHQRIVVSYTPRGDPNAADRIGAFVTAVRLNFGAPWRLLDVGVRP